MSSIRNSFLACLAAAGLAFASAPSQAALINAGQFAGTDCGGAGGFTNCYAETTGVSQSPPGSPTIYKLNNVSGTPGNPDFGTFASITGSEFTLTFDSSTHVLSWTYTAGANDPEIHYFTIKQGNSYNLWYDLVNPITSFSIDLDTIGYNSYSHVTWFDTGSTTTNVPVPGVLGLLGAGLMALGIAARRRRKS